VRRAGESAKNALLNGLWLLLLNAYAGAGHVMIWLCLVFLILNQNCPFIDRHAIKKLAHMAKIFGEGLACDKAFGHAQ
jgi:hypothetical protein